MSVIVHHVGLKGYATSILLSPENHRAPKCFPCIDRRVKQMKFLAEFSIANVANASNVDRWNSVATFGTQSLAAHSWNATLYSRYLALAIAPDMTMEDTLLLNDMALIHDLPETKTGDLPTPIKRVIEAYFPKGQSPLDLIEERICPPYKYLKERTKGTYLAVIVKLADIMDALHFITVQGQGPVREKIMRERTRAFNRYIQVGINSWPELSWNEASKVLDALLNDVPDQIDFEEIIADMPQLKSID